MIRKFTQSSISNTVDYRSMLAGNAAFSPGAYELIESQILTTTATSVTFASIPQTYRHLQIRWVARGTDSNLYMTLNTDNLADNYGTHTLSGNGTTVTSIYSTLGVQVSQRIAGSANTANAFTSGITDILDYTANKTTTVKTLAGVADSAGSKGIQLTSGMRDSTTGAVTAIRMDMAYGGSGIWQVGSRFSLYGIKG